MQKCVGWDPGEESIHEARVRVLETIRANAAYSFQSHGEEFTQRIVNVAQDSDGVHWIEPCEEWIEGFANGWDLLKAEQLQPGISPLIGVEKIQQGITLLNGHQELVMNALNAGVLSPVYFSDGQSWHWQDNRCRQISSSPCQRRFSLLLCEST